MGPCADIVAGCSGGTVAGVGTGARQFEKQSTTEDTEDTEGIPTSRKEREKWGTGIFAPYVFANAMAWRTWPFVFFSAAAAWARGAAAASITTATGVRLPAAFSALAAAA